LFRKRYHRLLIQYLYTLHNDHLKMNPHRAEEEVEVKVNVNFPQTDFIQIHEKDSIL